MGVEKNTSAAVCATALLRRPNGIILMQRRDDGSGTSIPYPNMWNLPGGAAELGEKPPDAAIREIAEEFEIKLEPAGLKEIWRYTWRTLRLITYFCVPFPLTRCRSCKKVLRGHGRR